MYVKYIRRCLMLFVRSIRSFVRFLLIWSLIHFLVNFGPWTKHISFVCTLHVSIISSWNDVRGRDYERRTILFSLLSLSVPLFTSVYLSIEPPYILHLFLAHPTVRSLAHLNTQHILLNLKRAFMRETNTHTRARASLARDCHFRNLYQIDSTRC